jgi:hypothetical protein
MANGFLGSSKDGISAQGCEKLFRGNGLDMLGQPLNVLTLRAANLQSDPPRFFSLGLNGAGKTAVSRINRYTDAM